MKLLAKFRLADEKEDFQTVSENIENGIVFKGTNLWILIFAIFIASLGLNVNSTAVIIGAMLVSPLMGPIIGIGFGMGVNNLSLVRKSVSSYFFASGIGLATSTVFFLISPINQAHSEILARISPNIYDVLIAFFGGLAGILAISSKLKGNVVTGVAIATALMPPLCTAGYGLATWQFSFFFGAFYLFFINSVFIALATLITTRFLKFPIKHLTQKEDEIRANRIVWVIAILTLLPSIYFGYDLIQMYKYEKRANTFIDTEAIFKNDYLLKKKIDAKNKYITITFGGQKIDDQKILELKSKLSKYKLDNTTLSVLQGFAYLQENVNEDDKISFANIINEKEKELKKFATELANQAAKKELSKQIFLELSTQYPNIESFILQPAIKQNNEKSESVWIAILQSKNGWTAKDKLKIEEWLKVRLTNNNITISFN